MNSSAVELAPEFVSMPDWRRIAWPLGLGLLLLGAIFNQEVTSAIHNWNASTAYNHCYLVIPIALYLLWDRRHDLGGLEAEPKLKALLLGVPLAVVWLAAERLGIMEGRQLAAMSFVEVLLFALLGPRLWRALAGPLLYLYFLVPFGEFLTPKLQDVTTWFISQGAAIIGIPAYIDGYIIEIPQGTFYVAQACAGLRFLIASIAFGCLYALIMYRSPMRRTLFILASIVIPVIANGFRGLGIVWLGWMLGSAEAAATDHVLYGWIFFSIVIVVLILVGLPFREDDQPTREASVSSGIDLNMQSAFAVVVGIALLAAASPAVAYALNTATEAGGPVPEALDIGPGCIIRSGPTVEAIRSELATCDGEEMVVSWTAFSPRITAGPIMAARRRMVARALSEGMQQEWFAPGEGSASRWMIYRSPDPVDVTAVSIWVGGKPVRPGLATRMRMAVDSLFGAAYAPTVVTISPAVNWEKASSADVVPMEQNVKRFLRGRTQMDTAVGRQSAL